MVTDGDDRTGDELVSGAGLFSGADPFSDAGLPPRDDLPRWVAPLPTALENLTLRLVWLVVAINLAGTAFGFWYYRFQFARVPREMWLFVPDSPAATLFVALALGAWALGRQNDYLTALAFVGNVSLGFWSPFVILAFTEAWFDASATWLVIFLFTSHLAMVAQAFLLHRISEFPVRAVAVATAWYTVDLLMDFFVPILGRPTHTPLPLSPDAAAFTTTALQVAAGGAVLLTVLPIFLALATRVKKLEERR